ncbi:MAG: amidase [Rhodospirillales bacterium]|nr:amidase [Rhodospirillales bacterium]
MSMFDDLAMMPARDMVGLFRNRKLSPVEATQAALKRIAAFDETYNAFLLTDPERALADAAAAEARWMAAKPLGAIDGVPSTIKEVVLSKHWPTRRGSLTTDADQECSVDAPCVARMREQGAVFLGKTNSPEFGWKGVTDSPLAGITRNPWNAERAAGGSSGGAAVAAALGFGALHIGNDAAGSVRIPAAFCGIFAHKPTFGQVPAYPWEARTSLAHFGPMTRTVADAALMLNVVSRPDWRDWFALPYSGEDFLHGLDDGIKGKKIAFSRTLGFAPCDPEVLALVERAVDALAGLGAIIEECDPNIGNPRQLIEDLWNTGLAYAVDGVAEDRRHLLEPGLVECASRAAGLSAVDRARAELQREEMGRTMADFHRNYDLLITPQMPLAAFEAGKLTPPGSNMDGWLDWSPYTYPFNLTHQPAASVPCGLTASGLPVAMQVVGPKYADALVLRAARAYEAVHPFAMPDAQR